MKKKNAIVELTDRTPGGFQDKTFENVTEVRLGDTWITIIHDLGIEKIKAERVRNISQTYT